MAGIVVHVIPKRVYEFSPFAVAGTIRIPLMEHIDVSAWRAGTLIVRVHAKSIGTGSFEVAALAEAPAMDDPGLFFQSGVGTRLAIVTINAGSPAQGPFSSGEAMETAAFSTDAGSHVTVILSAIQTGSLPLDLRATLSVDLALKTD